jgi:peptidoglycan/LPS O-acetylase OafA/YrhL
MKLSTFSQGRNNNFNLIRIAAAFAVLVTHSFALSIGSGDAEPFRKSLGMTMGSIAVDVFFITSGFLVTASLINRQSTIEFIWARALRIFPALFVMLFLTVFVLGIFFTSLPLSSYLSSPNTYIYITKCATLIGGVGFNLPGVFDSNPFKSTVNGSLWSMTYEVRMYAILAVSWFITRTIQNARLTAFKIIVATFALIAGIYVLASHFYLNSVNLFGWLFFMFFIGAAFYVLKEYITLSRAVFWLFLCGLIVATSNKDIFYIFYVFTIPYLLFYLAYVPSGLIRRYNQLGDYSYGIYIYAFPIQQSAAALNPGISVTQMFLISTAATTLLAVFSWHLVEQKALQLKANHFVHPSSTKIRSN